MGNIACLMAAGVVGRSYIEELQQMPLNIQLKITKRFTCWISGGHQEDANRILMAEEIVKSDYFFFGVSLHSSLSC